MKDTAKKKNKRKEKRREKMHGSSRGEEEINRTLKRHSAQTEDEEDHCSHDITSAQRLDRMGADGRGNDRDEAPWPLPQVGVR